MDWLKLFVLLLAGIHLLSAALQPSLIGKIREPMTTGVAQFIIAMNGVIAGLLVLVFLRL